MSHEINSATLDVVHKEVENTLQAVEQSLSRFLDDRDSGEDLQNCIDQLNQLRGIFVVVELQGAETLAAEAVQLATEVPVGAADDKNELLSKLSDSVFVLKRYTEFLQTEKIDFPELLLDTINQLRLQRKKSVFLESHFHEFDSTKQIDLAAVIALDKFSPLGDFSHHAHRYRHMFQTGLLSILRSNDTTVALKLIDRSLEGAARLSVGYAMAPLYAYARELVSSLEHNQTEFTDERKRLFMQIEKLFRLMVSNGEDSRDESPDQELMREIAFLHAVVDQNNLSAKQVLDQIDLAVRYTEQERVDAKSRLMGPGSQVIDSLSQAVSEDLMTIKEKLDLFERGSSIDEEDINLVSEVLTRLSSVLIVLNLPRLSADCTDKAAIVQSWIGAEESIVENDLLLVADSIIGVEAALAKYKESGSDIDHVLVEKDPDNHFLKEANMMVVEESQSSLVLTKRSITAYVESAGDKLHLTNIGQALDSARGGMLLLGRARVASVIAASEKCIQQELLDSQSLPDEKLLETLADALSSIEYYIDSLGKSSSSNDDLLKLSEDSLKSIGYDVVA
ncbi:hypothetical protein A3762_08800 [Oleiphilus sp. HI0125]|uniref:hypothetical protein n=1 Tax=Oleiphilus sp. HI0125 TaxID=1822266 RepID=UPI0007C339CD|nr:hypothetical protein [Oleiphilus sp. HI0125]KZZ58012.1 hypothetical protein A3762_08800 [Oleiphilus sp. HI0125]